MTADAIRVGRTPHGLRVLLVEDNPVNQRVEMTLLLKAGHEVDLAEDGSEALLAISRKTYDLILMDIQMPVMDGLAAAAEIRVREAKAGQGRVPIIAVTARAMKGDRDQCIRAGMDDYLTKPIGRGDLERIIQKWRPRRDGDTGGSGERESDTCAGQEQGEAARSHPLPSHGDYPAILERFRELGMLDDPQVAREMMETFLEDAARLTNELEGSLSARDKVASQSFAHSLKGISLNVGAGRLAELARELEDLILDVDLGDAAGVFERLLRELAGVRTFAPSVVANAVARGGS